MKSAFVAAVVLAAAALPVAAQAPDQPALGPQIGPDQVPAGTYVIDTKETQVRYATIHMGFTKFYGNFPGTIGTMTLDPKNLAATKVDIKVPVWLLDTTNRELDAELMSDLYFNEIRFRTMRFVSTGLTRTGPRTAKLAGDLTIRGVTKPIVLDVTFTGAGPNAFSKVTTLGFSATGMVKRSDFGMGKYVPIVSDETEISISAAFELKPAG